MSWECPFCGECMHGISNELDLLLAKDTHAEWGDCEYLGLSQNMTDD